MHGYNKVNRDCTQAAGAPLTQLTHLKSTPSISPRSLLRISLKQTVSVELGGNHSYVWEVFFIWNVYMFHH